jgi:hypothetical protein
MKHSLITIMLALAATAAVSQPRWPDGPGPNNDPRREHWEQRWRPHPGHTNHPENCREWRREVRWHPRLILPYYCRYDERPRHDVPVGPPRPGPK